MVRMRDVARNCRVAESTVSHVLNGTKYVSPEVRDRVLHSVRSLNYVGNGLARQLARGTSDVIGLIVSDIENPFLPQVIKSFGEAAQKGGYDVMLAMTAYDPARTARALQTMIRNKVAAVAVMTSHVDQTFGRMLADNDIPSVFLDGEDSGGRVSAIRLDYRGGVSAALAHLAGLGHRRLAILAGPQARASHAAYLDAAGVGCAELGLAHEVIEGANTVAGGEASIELFLKLQPRPTAMLCSNDLSAIGALNALRRAGLVVPRDVSLIGADDIAFAALTDPPLTTIRMPMAMLGEEAFAILHRSLGTARSASSELLPTTLVARASTGPVSTDGLGA